MSHIVVCPASVTLMLITKPAELRRSTLTPLFVHMGNPRGKKQNKTEHSAIGKALELTRSQKRHIAEYSWSQLRQTCRRSLLDLHLPPNTAGCLSKAALWCSF